LLVLHLSAAEVGNSIHQCLDEIKNTFTRTPITLTEGNTDGGYLIVLSESDSALVENLWQPRLDTVNHGITLG
jgi:hypothetical protein